jgi:hypothetical protein
VLDFAKPIRFQLAPANLNDVCRASAAAAWAGHDDAEVQLDLDPGMPTAVTDAERLRTALVNILTNARQRFMRPPAPARRRPGRRRRGQRPVRRQTARSRSGRHQRAGLRHGYRPDDMGHISIRITTRRKGTDSAAAHRQEHHRRSGGTITDQPAGCGHRDPLDLPLTAEAVA